jgi:hypothetical protein
MLPRGSGALLCLRGKGKLDGDGRVVGEAFRQSSIKVFQRPRHFRFEWAKCARIVASLGRLDENPVEAIAEDAAVVSLHRKGRCEAFGGAFVAVGEGLGALLQVTAGETSEIEAAVVGEVELADVCEHPRFLVPGEHREVERGGVAVVLPKVEGRRGVDGQADGSELQKRTDPKLIILEA